jgi:hypothetical protein
MKQLIDKLDEINFQITQKIRSIRNHEGVETEQIQGLKSEILDLLEKTIELEIELKRPKIDSPAENIQTKSNQAEETPKVIEEEEKPIENSIADSEVENLEEDSEDYAKALENEINQTIQSHTSQKSIGDQFKQTQNKDNSLGDRFRKKKLNHLKDAMGINEKFLFTNELFNGSTELFIKEIEVLNQQNSYSEATIYFKKLESKLNWKEESKATKLLFELIERRYL